MIQNLLPSWIRCQYSSLATQKNAGVERNKFSEYYTSTTNAKRATLGVLVYADGSKLPPMLILKRADNGKIAKKEFPSFPPCWKYYCKKNAWMDERVMIDWVESILKPFIEME